MKKAYLWLLAAALAGALTGCSSAASGTDAGEVIVLELGRICGSGCSGNV